MTIKILVVDNYDSFVFTLVGYVQQFGAETTVIRNDDLTSAEARDLAEQHDGVRSRPAPAHPPRPVSASTSSTGPPSATNLSSGCASVTRRLPRPSAGP